MASDWYLKIADKEVGPLSSQQLKVMARKGQLTADDLIRQGSAGAWVPAGRVKGLLTTGDSDSSDSTVVNLPTAKPLDDPPEGPAKGTISITQKGKPAPKARSAGPKTAVPLGPSGSQPAAQGPAMDPNQAARLAAGVPLAAGIPTGIPMGQAGPGMIPPGVPMPGGAMPNPMMPGASVPGAPAMGMVPGAPPPGMAVGGGGAGGYGVVAPAPVASSRPGAAAPEGKKKKRDKNAIYLVALVLLALALGGVTIAMLQSRSPAPKAKTASKPAKMTPAEQPKPDVHIEGLDELAELAGGKEPAKEAVAASATGAAEPPAAVSADPEWADAINGSVARGTVKVKVIAVEKGPVRFRGGSEDCLALRLQFSNSHDTKMCSYSWSRAQGVSLTDNFDNRYSLKSVKEKSGSIYPGSSLEEMLVFQKPVPKAAFLRLQFPAAAFDEDGTVRFKIPVSMIQNVEEVEPEAAPKRPVRPRTPPPVAKEETEEPMPPLSPDEPVPPERGIPAVDRSIEEMEEEGSKTRPSGESPEDPGDMPPSRKPAVEEGGIPGVVSAVGPSPPPKKRPGDPDGDVSQINQDIEEMGGGDKQEDVKDFESDPQRMAEFEALRRQQKAEQEAKKKAARKSR